MALLCARRGTSKADNEVLEATAEFLRFLNPDNLITSLRLFYFINPLSWAMDLRVSITLSGGV